MTDKEQIMIDGVDVSGCRYFDKVGYKLDVYDCDLNELPRYCSCNNDCYFKQLARKTQECEELENKIKKLRKNLALEIETNDRHCKALERVEFEAAEELKNLEADTDVYGCLFEILNIINKAKGEEDKQ